MKRKNEDIEHALISLAINSSEVALRTIYEHYCVPVSRYILMYTKSKEITEELLSDVFFSVWENRETLTEISNFDAYVYKIAKFKCLNYLRGKKIEMINLDEVSVDVFAFTNTSPEVEYISKESLAHINATIEALPPKCKLAFKLVREDKMKYKDAAEHLNISIKTLENHLTTAVKKIRERLNIKR